MYRTHGLSHLPEYRIWHGMRQRCRNPNTFRYEDYGGRGISVCKRWNKFVNFYADMGPRPSPEYSLDRINNDGPYKKSNCRWATRQTQSRNGRGCHKIMYRGKNLTIQEWSERYGINRNTLDHRVKRGWDFEVALTLAPDIANSITRSRRYKKRDAWGRFA